MWKTVIVLVPLLGASMVAVSRIMDARHHPFDVISSSILGMFVAWVSYRQYFPSLGETGKKGRAYEMRSWGSEALPPTPEEPTANLIRDEEEGKLGPAGERGINDGAIVDIHGQRRRQYLEEQEILEHNRRSAHDFYDTYTGSNQALVGDQPTYNPTPLRDASYEEYEMSNRKGAKPVGYKPYSGSSAARGGDGGGSGDELMQGKPGSRGIVG